MRVDDRRVLVPRPQRRARDRAACRSTRSGGADRSIVSASIALPAAATSGRWNRVLSAGSAARSSVAGSGDDRRRRAARSSAELRRRCGASAARPATSPRAPRAPRTARVARSSDTHRDTCARGAARARRSPRAASACSASRTGLRRHVELVRDLILEDPVALGLGAGDDPAADLVEHRVAERQVIAPTVAVGRSDPTVVVSSVPQFPSGHALCRSAVDHACLIV